MKNIKLHPLDGFTLIELLVVMSILGILVTIVAQGFRTAQMKGRDAQRKSDLKNVANALEVLYQDHGRYPDGIGGRIKGCPYQKSTPENSVVCVWGSMELTDGLTTYFKKLPIDPAVGHYHYRVVSGSNNQKIQIFAHLENSQDPDCIDKNCTDPATAAPAGACGTNACNFAVTSANTNATEN